MIKHLIKNKSGFTLTEVLVAVMVLVTSIVGTTNLLVSMMRSNSANANTLQAYFYTQEGLEAFRNMRDTYFMNNVDYRGKGQNFFGVSGGFSGFGSQRTFKYFVNVKVDSLQTVTQSTVSSAAPFTISNNSNDAIVKFYEGQVLPVPTSFSRECSVEDYSDDSVANGEAKKGVASGVVSGEAVKVTCTTSWEERSTQREVSLSMILTDWKDD